MSYREFVDEVFRVLGREGVPILKVPQDQVSRHLNTAQQEVFDGWFANHRYDGLIAWILENFDTTSGDEYITPLSARLVDRKDEKRLRTLWKGIISTRRSYFGKPVPDNVIGLSRSRAEVRDSAIWAMNQFCSALETLGSTEQLRLAREVLADFRSGKRRPVKKIRDGRKMDEALFWQFIEESKDAGHSCNEMVESLTEKLEALGLREIRTFQKILFQCLSRAYTWGHWALAYISRNGCSDDEFDYFRAWLVTKGKDSFLKAIDDLESAADLIDQDPQCEGLLYAAEHAFENKSGDPLGYFNRKPPKLTGPKWSEDQLPKMFPSLCSRFKFR